MSLNSPWLALAADWLESDMFEDDDHTDGSRLAWVCLLCHVKVMGRAGRAKVRRKSFARRYDLSDRSVDIMLKSAQEHRAIEVDGDDVTICNWRAYQIDRIKGKRGNAGNNQENGDKPTTNHQSHITNHQSTPHSPPRRGAGGGEGKKQPWEPKCPAGRLLRHMGIGRSKVRELIDECPTLTVPQVAQLWHEAGLELEPHLIAGRVVARIADGVAGMVTPTPRAVWECVQAGWVTGVRQTGGERKTRELTADNSGWRDDMLVTSKTDGTELHRPGILAAALGDFEWLIAD